MTISRRNNLPNPPNNPVLPQSISPLSDQSNNPSTPSSTLTANSPHSLPTASTSGTRPEPIPGLSTSRELRPSKNVNYKELHYNRAQFLKRRRAARNSVQKLGFKVRKLTEVSFPPFS
jgi:hypothetical protein